jgi:hypothetical protein
MKKVFYHGCYFFGISKKGSIFKGVENRTTGYYSASVLRDDSLLVVSSGSASAEEYLRKRFPGTAKRLGLTQDADEL